MAEIIPFPCIENEMAQQLAFLAERAHRGDVTGIVLGVKRSDGLVETMSICADFAELTDIVSAINDARTVALIDANLDE